ncbi:hypothetical protein J3R30DRAFT_3698197 [Lentinula aciculospora]|uniref:F-box domain-containing protein n=1 Tax=Lentinula aciculospora TaxID=153920 RepID=A0A9W9AJW6_9AGAR|nr:hypothetical protein J3R30DRAFT_3698197 [Lentinula aciculospora]
MDLAPSNLENTLKRRRGRRNLKRGDDTDSVHSDPAARRSSISVSQRPSSSGASSSSYAMNSLPHAEDENFVQTEHSGHIHLQFEDISGNTRELTRSMTADILGSTRPSIHDWDKDTDSASDSETASVESLTHSDLPIAFINQLPNELLTLIFSFGSQLPHFELRYPLSPVPPFKSPSLVETVMKTCRRWRQLIKHTPSLWTNVLISRSRSDLDSLPSVADFQKPMSSVTAALQRSSNLLLDIMIDLTHISSKTAIRQLSAESERWRSLSILVQTSQNLPAVLSHLKDIHAPELQTLEITAHKFHDGDSPHTSAHGFLKSSLRLSTVRLNRVGLRWSASPLRGLTTLELRFVIWPSHTDFQNLFTNSPELQNLKLHFDTHAFNRLDRNNGPTNMLRPLIKIPCLRTLELRFIYHDSSSTHNVILLLQLFSLPVLEELIFKDFGTAEWCRSLVYFRCYAKSFPQLRRLVLDRVKDIIYVDSSLVRAFPRLTSLHLRGVYSSAFCHLLCGARTQELGAGGLQSSPLYDVEVWPCLEELIIEQDKEGKIDLVAEAVRARKQMGRSLKTVQLDRPFFDKAEQEGQSNVITWMKQTTNVRYI